MQYLRSSSIWSSAKGSILLGGTPVSWVALKDFATLDMHHSVIGERNEPALHILDEDVDFRYMADGLDFADFVGSLSDLKALAVDGDVDDVVSLLSVTLFALMLLFVFFLIFHSFLRFGQEPRTTFPWPGPGFEAFSRMASLPPLLSSKSPPIHAETKILKIVSARFPWLDDRSDRSAGRDAKRENVPIVTVFDNRFRKLVSACRLKWQGHRRGAGNP